MSNECRLINIFTSRIHTTGHQQHSSRQSDDSRNCTNTEGEWRRDEQEEEKEEEEKEKRSSAAICIGLFVCRSSSRTENVLCSLWVSRQISRLIARAVSTRRYALQKQVVMSPKMGKHEKMSGELGKKKRCRVNKKRERERERAKGKVQTRNICTNES